MNRKSLEDQFLSQGPASWKTFVLDVHAQGDPHGFLVDVFGKGGVRETDDRHLRRVEAPGVEMVVDSLDDRFWSFHSLSPADVTKSLLKAAVARRRDLDFVWLPSAHLRMIQWGSPRNWIKTEFQGKTILPPTAVQELSVKVRGREAQALLDVISQNREFPYAVSVSQLGIQVNDPDFGSVVEAVDRKALFVARGDSFALHQNIVQSVVVKYRGLVESAERVAIGFDALGHHYADADGESGGRSVGGPIELAFSRPLPDLNMFLDGLLSSREPFRLWGIANDVSDEYTEVEAVDLHVGQRIRIEVSPTMMRIHLRRGGCGNTVARLVSNIQHHVDGGLIAVDPSIQAHLAPEEPVAA